MQNPASQRITIVGAGLSGCLLAGLLGRRGFSIDVFEQRPDPRQDGFIGGRSINLAISTRGLTALAQAGLEKRVLEISIPMRGRIVHGRDSSRIFQPYSSNPADAIHSVSRGDLNLLLLDHADTHETVHFHFEQECLVVDPGETTARFSPAGDGSVHPVRSDLIVGCDGANSVVRRALEDLPGFEASTEILSHGYRELSLPPPVTGGDTLEPNALHIWPRGGEMMIALPNLDGSFTCTTFWPREGSGSFAERDSQEDVARYFRDQYPDAVRLMPDLEKDFSTNPVGILGTVRCSQMHGGSTVLLVGDAAHAIVPFYGQGMNAAFEDCRILDDLVEELGPDWKTVLPAFSTSRIEHCAAIADMALLNFIEMRDHVSSRWFRVRKKWGQALHRLLPGYVPLYSMISFSNRPYAEARARARRQQKVVRAILLAGGMVIVIALLLLLR